MKSWHFEFPEAKTFKEFFKGLVRVRDITLYERGAVRFRTARETRRVAD